MKALLVPILLSVLAVQAFMATIIRATERPAAGNTVTFRNVREVYASMTSSITTADLTKGEFETTAQFEARSFWSGTCQAKIRAAISSLYCLMREE
jgi:hypothetical protein